MWNELKRLSALFALSGVVAAWQTLAVHAEPVLDRALSGLRVVERKGCTIVKIDFNLRVRYASHFPVERGTELRVAVRSVDPGQATALAILKREALRPPQSSPAGITAIEFEAGHPTGPELRLSFKAPAAFKVAQGGDFTSVIIAVSGTSPSTACRPELGTNSNEWNTVVTPSTRAPAPPAAAVVVPPRARTQGDATAERQAAAWMDEARAALKKADYPAALSLLNKARAGPETPVSADALELLAVTHQKAGSSDRARALFEEYLSRYSSNEGADRVRQRLAGIATASDHAKSRSGAADGAGREGGSKLPNQGTTWSVSGSASQFYIRDDSYKALRDPSLPPDINFDKDAHRVHQNMLLTSFDLVAAINTGTVKSKFRFSGSEEHSFNDDGRDLIAIAALSYEASFRELDLTTKIGRQTRNTGGVLGRFDGAVASWQATPTMRLNAVAGSPVERRSDEPFKNERYFYGASVDIGPMFGGIETSLFAIEQRDRTLLDRQAIGAELRYLRPDKSMFALVDYDTHFNVLNAAMLNGSATFADKSVLSAVVDYRKAPYLSAWTALQGQPFLRLYDMIKAKAKEEIDQLAIDRTATYKSAMVGYARPINEKLQFSVDATVSDISGTIASGGVDAVLPQGTEYFASAQLIGSGLVTPDDMYIGALRYAHRPDSDLYVLDLSTRYLWTPDLRISPRLRLGYRMGSEIDLKEVSVMPSILFNYLFKPDLSFELEAGANWTRRDQFSVRETTTDVFFTAGFRYDFYADGRSKCPSAEAKC